MTIKLSAALLHEYLAGKMDAEKFRQRAFGSDQQNQFAAELERGNSIRKAHFAPGGIDRDDDYVILELDIDPQRIVGR
jgi:hypothetical protein